MKRLPLLDLYRFLAIVLMVFFHLSFDLSLFGQFAINFKEDPFWFGLPRLIVLLFYTAAGISLRIVHFPQINWSSLKKRSWQLGLGAIAVTITTKIMYPHNFVYFGTLHCLFVGTFAALPLLKYPRMVGLLGLVFLVSNYIFRPEFFHLGKYIGSPDSIDYIPLYPWLGAFWLGIWMHSVNAHKLLAGISYPGERLVHWCSRHALAIYLLHQPLLFGLSFFFFKLLPSWTK